MVVKSRGNDKISVQGKRCNWSNQNDEKQTYSIVSHHNLSKHILTTLQNMKIHILYVMVLACAHFLTSLKTIRVPPPSVRVNLK
jgi:hypothetical protein